MKKNNFQFGFFVLISIAGLILFFANICYAQLGAAGMDDSGEAISAKQDKKPAQQESDKIARPKEAYAGEGLNEPFRPPFADEVASGTESRGKEVAVVQPPALDVQGVIKGWKFDQAIINGKIVKVGDEVEGAKILNIEKNAISIIYNNVNFDLPTPAAKTLQGLNTNTQGG